MGKHSCCFKQKLRKGLWSPDEDEKLSSHITKYGHGCWSSVPKQAGLQRCGKSCRLRWINYLRPDLKRGTFSVDEENLILELHKVLGNRWSQIAAQLPGRTDNEIKNLWNSCLKKKLRQRGIDPVTHKLLSEVEDREKTNVITTINSIDAVYGISNELNHILYVKKSKSNASILQPPPSSVSAQKYSSELEGTLKMQTLETTGCWVNQQLDYAPSSMISMNQNSNSLWFTQQSNAKYGMNSEFSLINNTIPANSQSSTINTSFDMNNNRHFWEMGASSNSSSESNHSIENSLFSWGNSTPSRESQIHSTENIQENIKWPEILRNPFLMAAATFQNQPFYSEIKTETQFDSSRDTSDIWTHYNQQQQEPLQTSDVGTVAFGHI